MKHAHRQQQGRKRQPQSLANRRAEEGEDEVVAALKIDTALVKQAQAAIDKAVQK